MKFFIKSDTISTKFYVFGRNFATFNCNFGGHSQTAVDIEIVSTKPYTQINRFGLGRRIRYLVRKKTKNKNRWSFYVFCSKNFKLASISNIFSKFQFFCWWQKSVFAVQCLHKISEPLNQYRKSFNQKLIYSKFRWCPELRNVKFALKFKILNCCEPRRSRSSNRPAEHIYGQPYRPRQTKWEHSLWKPRLTSY